MKKAVDAINQAWPLVWNRVRAKVPPALADAFKEKVMGSLLPIAEAHDKRTAAADGNASLSETGRAKERAAAGDDVQRDAAAFVEATAGVLDKRRGDALAAVVARVAAKPPSDPAERIGYESWSREVRDSLRSLTRTERNLALQVATDPRVIAAIENAPPTMERATPGALPRLVPFVDPEVIAAARLARAKATASPEAMAEMEAWDQLAGAYRTIAAFVVGAIDDDAPKLPRFKDPRTGAPIAADPATT